MNWNWKGVLQAANQYGMDGYRPGVPQAPQGYVPYEATLNQRGLSNNMQPDNSIIPSTTYQPYNFGNRQPQAVAQLEAEQQAEAEALQRQSRIAALESEIKEIESRIATNMTKLQNFTGNVDQIAAIEARKINTADPTSIWRWKVDRDEARRIANEQNKSKDIAKTNTLIEATNAIENMVVDPLMDTSTKNAMLSKLADIKSNLQKNGLPTKMADDKIREIKGEIVQTTETTPAAGLPFRGTPKEIGTAQADNIIQKGIEKVTQKEINELKRQVESGEIIVDNEKMNEIDDLYNKVVERDKQRTLNRRYEEARKKLGITKEQWGLMSKEKKKLMLNKAGA